MIDVLRFLFAVSGPFSLSVYGEGGEERGSDGSDGSKGDGNEKLGGERCRGFCCSTIHVE